MCGIAGIYSKNGRQVDLDELTRMRDRMANRGPDSKKNWINQDGFVGLAHRRLAIIETSDLGMQPMHDCNGNAIVFNGEIYNFKELREELKLHNKHFRTDSDTEVLLHMYSVFGELMLEKLRGMFAFAIYDVSKGSLFLARDPLGIKPLYYSESHSGFKFASQVNALLAAECIDSSKSPAGHVGFLLMGYIPDPFTFYRGINSLSAGHCMVVQKNNKTSIKKYFDMRDLIIFSESEENSFYGSREAGIKKIVNALKSSVKAHITADVPVGVFLSSGIDSTAIAVCVNDIADLRTITISFEEFKGSVNDEAPLAEFIAARLNSCHQTKRVYSSEFSQERDNILAAMDQPSTDGVNTWFAARAAIQENLKVMLSGLGGDEILGSYPSFRDVPRIVRYCNLFAWQPILGRYLRILLSPLIAYISSPKYAGIMEYGSTYGGAYFLRRALFMPWELTKFLGTSFIRDGLRQLDIVNTFNASIAGIKSSRLKVSALEIQWYMKNQLLRDSDWASMDHSLELRTPLVDVYFIKECLPVLIKYPDIKKSEIIMSIDPLIGANLINNPKTGFSTPIKEWLIKTDKNLKNQKHSSKDWARKIYEKFIHKAN